MKSEIRNSEGFTLVEMIVAIGIFMIVAVVAVGALVRVVALNRQAQSLQSSVNNVSFALDSMSREIRQGADMSCVSGYTGGSIMPGSVSTDCEDMTARDNQLIMFMTSKTDPAAPACNLYEAYWFDGSVDGKAGDYIVKKAQQSFCNQLFFENVTSTDFYPIIDTSTVTVTNYSLAMFSGDLFPYKWVFIRLSGIAGVRTADQNSFDVETSVSQRVSG